MSEMTEYKNMLERNKETVRRMFAAIDEDKFEAFKDCMVPDFCLVRGGQRFDIEGHWANVANGHRAAYPDMRHHVEQQIAEGDYVVTRGTITATNTGTYHGRPATNRAVKVPFMNLATLREGKIENLFSTGTSLAEYEQLYGKLF